MAAMCLAGSPGHGQEDRSYLCAAEKVAGFSWSGQEWVVTDFAAAGERFVVQPATPPEWIAEIFDYEIRYSVTAEGRSEPEFWCGRATHGGQLSPIIACGGSGHGFRLNVETRRFMLNYGLGYLDGRDSNDTTPHLTIGSCTVQQE
ncbi:MAG TPA: hypothetical protein VHG92_14745 [Afifellaceae bacterium]|nr:hypothetical protein [Afifellaceae bacterium]